MREASSSNPDYGHTVWQVPLVELMRQDATRLKIQVKRVPTKAAATIIATAIKAASKPYSMAVTPSSSRKKLTKPLNKLFMNASPLVKKSCFNKCVKFYKVVVKKIYFMLLQPLQIKHLLRYYNSIFNQFCL
jgi:hypothetical protein